MSRTISRAAVVAAAKKKHTDTDGAFRNPVVAEIKDHWDGSAKEFARAACVDPSVIHRLRRWRPEAPTGLPHGIDRISIDLATKGRLSERTWTELEVLRAAVTPEQRGKHRGRRKAAA